MKSVDKVARNFIQNRGREQFRLLIRLLERNTSGQKIADQFGVSRERVRQWKNTFGQTIVLYRPHPSIERLADSCEEE